MIEILISILEKLITWNKGRKDSWKDMFNTIFTPIFDELLLIHGDYIEMFSEVMWMLPSHSSKSEIIVSEHGAKLHGFPDKTCEEFKDRLEKAKKELLRRRIEFEPVREKIKAIANTLDRVSFPEEERLFIQSVLDYFPTGEHRIPDTSATTLIGFLKKTDQPASISWMIDNTINSHKLSWSNVCVRYASLKSVIAQL